jgi:hypothetical protein
MDDYSYVERRPDHLRHDRKILLDRGNDAESIRAITPCSGPSQAHFTYRASAYFPAKATMRISSNGGAGITSISAMTSGSGTAPSGCRAAVGTAP